MAALPEYKAIWGLCASICFVYAFYHLVADIRIRSLRMIPLRDAVVKIYEELRKSGDTAIEILKTDQRDLRFVHIAESFLGDGVVLYGTHHPSTVIERIPVNDMGTMTDECDRTTLNNGEPLWTNLSVRKNDLKKAIRALRTAPRTSP